MAGRHIRYDCSCGCGHRWSFTDIDLKNNEETQKAARVKSIGGVLSASSSYSIGDAVIGHHLISQGTEMQRQVVDFTRCPYCGSMQFNCVQSEFTPTFGTDEGIIVSGPGSKSKVTADMLAVFLGGLGVHKFYLGYTKEGVISLAVFFLGLLLCALPTLAICIIGLIEGFKYLTMNAIEFQTTYVNGHKGWF